MIILEAPIISACIILVTYLFTKYAYSRELNTLKAEKSYSEKIITNNEKEISSLKSKIFEIDTLKLQIEELKNKDIKSKYIFDKTTGIYKSKETNNCYCPSCLLDNKESPMIESDKGWRCTSKVCRQFYRNPKYECEEEQVYINLDNA